MSLVLSSPQASSILSHIFNRNHSYSSEAMSSSIFNATQSKITLGSNSTITTTTKTLTTITTNNNTRFQSNETTRSILIGLDVFNCILIGLCCCLLLVIFKRTKKKTVPELYVLNLAICEFFACVFLTGRDVLNLLRLQHMRHSAVDRSFWIANMFFVTAVQYIYILAMVYITADRFFAVVSPFR